MDKRHSFVQRNGSGRWRPKHGGGLGGDSNPLLLPPETLQQIKALEVELAAASRCPH